MKIAVDFRRYQKQYQDVPFWGISRFTMNAETNLVSL
jgi:hypothetical protein